MLVDDLVCSIAEHFYELYRILRSQPYCTVFWGVGINRHNTNNESNKLFITQLLFFLLTSLSAHFSQGE